MSAFDLSLKRCSNKILLDVNVKCYEILGELFTSVVNKTPSPTNPGKTATGLLANQWYPSVGSGVSGEYGTAISPNGANSLARINAIMNGLEFYAKDGKSTLTNNLNYAVQAEVTGWVPPRWKGTPPYRMIALSLQATVAKHKNVKI